jgi:hypothetical protein
MSNREYLTVSEYAEIKGISKQAVYQQLNKQLKEFLILVNGKKCVNISILTADELEKLKLLKQPDEQPVDKVEQVELNQFQALLENQLAEKDKVIESLLKQNEALQEQNTRLTELLHNSQVLLAAEKQLLVQGRSDISKEETEIKDEPLEPKKIGFIKRLFSRNK